MTDADTPRVPDEDTLSYGLHASAALGLFVEIDGGFYRASPRIVGLRLDARPADAVKLGDVEDLREQLHKQTAMTGEAVLAYENLRAGIRAVLDEEARRNEGLKLLTAQGMSFGEFIDRIRAILEREPGREEPNSQRTPSSPQTGSSARTLHGIVFPDHIEVDQLNNPETTIIRLQCLPHTFGRVTSGWINRGDTHLIREFVEAHAAHGHVVEHQPEGDR